MDPKADCLPLAVGGSERNDLSDTKELVQMWTVKLGAFSVQVTDTWRGTGGKKRDKVNRPIRRQERHGDESMLRMTTWGNSRTQPFRKYTGRFAYPMLPTVSREVNGPRRR